MPENGAKETARLEAFSDGVFAIAMTLLALELKDPRVEPATAGSLASGLLNQWPSYLAFFSSFFTVLVMWVHHHAIFRQVQKVYVRLLFANGFLLLLITAVPFPTAIVAQYLRTPAASVASGLYAGLFFLISIAFYLLLMAAFRESTLDPAASPETVERFRRDYKLGPPLYFLAAAAAPFSAWLSLGICTALWVFWLCQRANVEKRVHSIIHYATVFIHNE